ncbi:MAG TPA: hypothetical protein VGE51_10585 [Fontimonas sp.]
MNTKKDVLPRIARLTLLSAALGLAACNDDDALRGGDDGHGHSESSGRLAFAGADGDPQISIFDIDTRTTTQIALSNVPTAVYASPGRRYALVVQADADQVGFVDGGVYAHEDHVDVETPTLLDFTLNGAKPAHYQSHEEQSALFFDGRDSEPAQFALLTDASIGSGGIVASATLPAAVHGVAEPRDGYVLAVDYSLVESQAGTPRQAVKKYELHGDHFHDEGRLATPCENIHGAGTNDDYVAFGCQDGVLLVEQNGDLFTDRKIATPQRITQIAGHDDAALLAGFAGAADGDTLYVIDPVAGTAVASDWKQGATANRRQHAFDAHGEHLLILDSTGTLHVLEASATGFVPRGTVAVYSGDQTTARLATSPLEDLAYVTDPAGKSIAVIDLTLLEEVDRIDLDFAPIGIAWLGAADDTHLH